MSTNELAPVQVAHDPVQVGALLSKLDEISTLLRAQGSEERTSDSDQAYVIGGASLAPAVLSVQYPRTWRYVEITLNCCPPAGPAATVDVDNSAAGANTAMAATLPAGGVGVTTYLTGFEVTGDGATAGSIITVTITGIAGTKTYDVTVPAGAATPITPLQVEFTRPIPAIVTNGPISVNVPAFGAGNTNQAVTAHGYQSFPGGEIAMFDGNIVLPDAQNRHQHTTGQVQQSDAMAVVSSGNVKFRAYLNQTGYFTFLFTGAFTGYVNVRIRVLDKSQSRPVRT